MSLRGWTKRLVVAGSTLFVLAVFANPAQAQVSANDNVTATARVIGAPITATGVNNLDFGPVLGDGGTYTPASTADYGRWYVTGAAGAAVSVDFTTPSDLDNGLGDLIPITFGGSDGVEFLSDWSTVVSSFDPAGTYNTNIDAGGELFIAITGSIVPPVASPAGTYTATITMTVAYL